MCVCVMERHHQQEKTGRKRMTFGTLKSKKGAKKDLSGMTERGFSLSFLAPSTLLLNRSTYRLILPIFYFYTFTYFLCCTKTVVHSSEQLYSWMFLFVRPFSRMYVFLLSFLTFSFLTFRFFSLWVHELGSLRVFG